MTSRNLLAVLAVIAVNAQASDATLTMHADDTYHTLIQTPYQLNLQNCELSVTQASDQAPLECLDTESVCPVPLWFQLDEHYYEITSDVVFDSNMSIAAGLDLFNCRREATGTPIPGTAYLLEVFNAEIPLATEEGRALAYVANNDARILGARTFHGDAICDDAVTPDVQTPSMPWVDVIFSSTFTSGTL